MDFSHEKMKRGNSRASEALRRKKNKNLTCKKTEDFSTSKSKPVITYSDSDSDNLRVGSGVSPQLRAIRSTLNQS